MHNQSVLRGIAFVSLLAIGLSADTAVVTVNGNPIYRKNVDREVKSLLPTSTYHGNVTADVTKKIEKEAIDNLINKELLYQQALVEEISVGNSEVEAAEREMITAFGGKKNFDQSMKKADMSLSELRSELRKEKMIEKLYDKRIRYTITDTQLKEYYNQNRHKFKEPEKIKIALISREIDPANPKSRQMAKTKIDEAYAKIKSGKDFGEIAYTYSNDMSRIKGGDMGYIHKGMLQSPEVEKYVFGMKKGELSPVLSSKEGFFIVRMDGKLDEKQNSFEDVKVKLKSELVRNREDERKTDLLDKLKKNAKIQR